MGECSRVNAHVVGLLIKGIAALVQLGENRRVKRDAVPVKFCLGDWLILGIGHDHNLHHRIVQMRTWASRAAFLPQRALYISQQYPLRSFYSELLSDHSAHYRK